MRILVLCDRYPFPLYNGQNLRIYHYVRQLSERHNFDLLCYGDKEAPNELKPLFGEIDAYPRVELQEHTIIGRLVDTVYPPYMLPPTPRFRGELVKRLASDRYELVWMSGWETVSNIPRPCPIPFIADIVDDGVLEHFRGFRNRHGLLPRLKTLRQIIRHALFERYYFGPSDACLVVSERDAEVFHRLCPRTEVAVIHNGVDEMLFRPRTGEGEHPTVVFEGSMEFLPNIDAACFLVREVFPLLQRLVPAARVVLVGRDPAPEVRSLAGPSVTVTGFVDDVRPYLDQASVFVCPMRTGAGIKNKLLQAWAMGKPVVATTVATGGLVVNEGQNILVRDTPEAIAEALARLLTDQHERRRLGEAGRKTILASYTWRKKADELEALMERVVSRRSAVRSRAPV